MRVTGKLQVHATLRGDVERRGVMREQHNRAATIPARERALEILTMIATEQMRDAIVDAGEVERMLAEADRQALVAKHAPSELAGPVDPWIGAREVVVVSGYEKRPVPRIESAKRLDLAGEALDAAVDEVAGDRDHVWLKRVDAGDDRFRETPAEERADVHVGELHDAEGVERARPGSERQFDPADRRLPE